MTCPSESSWICCSFSSSVICLSSRRRAARCRGRRRRASASAPPRRSIRRRRSRRPRSPSAHDAGRQHGHNRTLPHRELPLPRPRAAAPRAFLPASGGTRVRARRHLPRRLHCRRAAPGRPRRRPRGTRAPRRRLRPAGRPAVRPARTGRRRHAAGGSRGHPGELQLPAVRDRRGRRPVLELRLRRRLRHVDVAVARARPGRAPGRLGRRDLRRRPAARGRPGGVRHRPVRTSRHRRRDGDAARAAGHAGYRASPSPRRARAGRVRRRCSGVKGGRGATSRRRGVAGEAEPSRGCARAATRCGRSRGSAPTRSPPSRAACAWRRRAAGAPGRATTAPTATPGGRSVRLTVARPARACAGVEAEHPDPVHGHGHDPAEHQPDHGAADPRRPRRALPVHRRPGRRVGPGPRADRARAGRRRASRGS